MPGKSRESADGDDTRQLEGLELELELEDKRMKSICEGILIQREQEVAAALILGEEEGDGEVCQYERSIFIDRERLRAEQQAFEEEELKKKKKKRRIEEMKKKETKPQMANLMRKKKDAGEIIQKNMESKAYYIAAADVDTDDEADEEEEEYEAFLVRNIARIKRDKEGREEFAVVRDKEMIENMTEEERREWELKPAGKQQQPKKHKYFHKGVFFLSQVDDDDDDDCAPTVEDR